MSSFDFAPTPQASFASSFSPAAEPELVRPSNDERLIDADWGQAGGPLLDDAAMAKANRIFGVGGPSAPPSGADVDRQVAEAQSLTTLGYGDAALAGVPADMRAEVAARVAKEAPAEGAEKKEEGFNPLEALEGFYSRLGDAGDIAHKLAPKSELGMGASFLSGTFDMISGATAMKEGNYAQGGIKMGKGAVSTAGTVADVVGNEGVSKVAGKLGPAFDVASSAYKFAHGDTQGGIEDGVSGVLGAVPGAGAPVAAAFKGGLGLGHRLDDVGAERNYFGQNQSIHEAAAATGQGAEDWLADHGAGHTLSVVGGGVTTLAATVADTAYVGAELATGTPSGHNLEEWAEQQKVAEEHRVAFFEKNRETMKTTNPELYKTANAQYGARADLDADNNAKMATLDKNDPQTAAMIRQFSHYAE